MITVGGPGPNPEPTLSCDGEAGQERAIVKRERLARLYGGGAYLLSKAGLHLEVVLRVTSWTMEDSGFTCSLSPLTRMWSTPACGARKTLYKATTT